MQWLQRPVDINKMLLKNSRSCHRSLSTAQIDYRKALKILQMYKIYPNIISFLTTSMKEWETNLYLNHSQGSNICENITIECGIFQCDSLPFHLFCLALLPHFYEFPCNGYNIYRGKINHLFYTDDLKLYGKNYCELDG